MRVRLYELGLACALMTVAAACGDNLDSSESDAAPGNDSGPEPNITQSGTILVLETAYKGFPMMGDGPFVVVKVQDNEDIVPPAYEVAPGSPFACKAWDLTPAEAADPGIDLGSFQFTVGSGGPVFPPCVFLPGLGWGCPDVMSTGGNIAVQDVDMGIMRIADTAVTFGADQVGRYVQITGAGELTNNGMFPIVSATDTQIRYINPAGVAEPDTAGQYVTLAGMGPAGQTNPIDDDATLTTELTAGGDGKFTDWTKTQDFGDHFTLDDASEAILDDVPMNGSAFSIGCDGAGGDCGSATATALDIVTTDGSIEGLPGFVMPPVDTKSVRIFCIFLVPTVDVPEEVSQFLADSGATRVRTIYNRAETTDEIQSEAQVTVVAGHARMGFTDP